MNDEKIEAKPLSDQKKTALLRYMAVLFAVAFLLVLVSFFLQSARSNEKIGDLESKNASALTKAEELQEQNRQLQDALDEANVALEDLNAQLDAAQSETQSLQESVDSMRGDLQEKERQLTIFEALTIVRESTVKEGNVSYSKAMETLRQNEPYMTEEARAAYQKLLTE